jgi:methionyl-tRNA formyltransferase
MQLAPSPVKTTALELGLTLMQPEKASSPSSLEEIRKVKPDAAAVVAYGQLLKPAFLELPSFGSINLHPSLLPRYRGASPIQSAIIAGESTTGVTTFLLNEAMDAGDILLQREVEISREDTAGSLHDKLADIGAELMVETFDAIESRSVSPRPQDESKVTVTRKIKKEYSSIDWTSPAEEIFNLTRALDPIPGSRTLFGDEFLKIWKVEPLEKCAMEGQPGEVLKAQGGNLIVQAGDVALKIITLQPSGGRKMSAEEFLRGHTVNEGTVLGK